MLDFEQALAYGAADFSDSECLFLSLFNNLVVHPSSGWVLDLGCGPASIPILIAQRYPELRIDGIDGSPAMLDVGRRAVSESGCYGNIRLFQGVIPNESLPEQDYDVLISNSLLHHLENPSVLWSTVQRYGRPGSRICIMDLVRPESTEEASGIVQKYADHEPDVLKRDFYHSLCAAYRVDEVLNQLSEACLEHLHVDRVSDRHWACTGIL